MQLHQSHLRLTLSLTLCLLAAGCGGGAATTENTPPVTPPVTQQTPGTVAFGTAQYTVAQNAGTVVLSVVRSQGSDGAITVAFATAAASAVPATDFTAASGTLNWPAGDATAKSISVPISNASPFTGSKSFQVTLSNATGGATLGSPGTATVTINGTQSPPGGSGGGTTTPGSLALSAASYTVAQNAGSVVITVTRTQGTDGAATAAYATSNGTATAGTDFTSTSGTLSWAAGVGGSRTFSVPISNGTPFSGTRSFNVVLSAPAGATLGTPSTAGISITGSAQPPSVSAAAALAGKLGRPARLLVGVGGGAEVAQINAQGLKPDVYDRYLVGVGAGAWPTWNSPSGAYVGVVAAAADSVGAVPMFTLYQMASIGDGNISGINDATFMAGYWANVKLMFQQLAVYGKPALVNFEPDFWGYAQRQAPGGDPTRLAAKVTIATECADLTNDVVGIAGCLLKMARQYAPKAYVGFPPATWGADSTAQLTAFMNRIGAANADFIVMQTSDRDAGCFEVVPQPAVCVRTGSPWYWDESNQTHPNFHDHFDLVQTYHTAVGGLPVVWWQMPFGAPSATPGGTVNHYRDNRVHYFLTHASEVTAVGGLAVVFGAGETSQTNITTDGNQFQVLSLQYLNTPQPLP